MAGQEFITRQRGRNEQVAFDQAVENAIEEYGNDPYNGTISTCTSYQDVTDEYKRSKMDKMTFINKKLEDCGNRYCFCIVEQEPVVNTNKIKSTVDHVVVKGTSKWELRYNVYAGWDDRQVDSAKTKAEAVAIARNYTEKTKTTTFVRMEKKLVNQNPNVASIRYKESSTEREGSYIFFGWGAC
jgi:hypothetical protein